jgi:hypothetical protein
MPVELPVLAAAPTPAIEVIPAAAAKPSGMSLPMAG